MKKKIISIMSTILVLGTLTGCNVVAKNFGGTSNLDLPANRKLMSCSWKDNSLWYLTRPMKEDEEAESYEYTQDSNSGIIEGKFIIKENKTK